jgi:hypothetical protein
MFIQGVHAADFSFVPSGGTLSANQEFTVQIKIDTAGLAINAAQGVLTYSENLQVKSISKEGSVFNFWLQEPTASNQKIEFIGGTPNGVAGSALLALKVVFIGKAIGQGDIVFTDGAITAADGTGSNIVDKLNGAKFIIGTKGSTSQRESLPENETIPTPVPIVRAPVQAKGIPSTPVLTVPLYPSAEKWHNNVAPFAVLWELPEDITGISTTINTDPKYTAPAKSEGLFRSKTFPAIEKDGEYYIHVRFQNSKGWGETAHYRIAVDTQPPLPFDVEVVTGLSSDNPSPRFAFSASDALSGIQHYMVTAGNEEPIIVAPNELVEESSVSARWVYTLPAHQPAKYPIRIQAVDAAGNSIEDRVDVDILPISMPEIAYITDTITRGTADTLMVRGTAVPASDVLVSFEDTNKLVVIEDILHANDQGVWVFQLERELRSGTYQITFQTRDARGALSLVTPVREIRVLEKALMTILGIRFTAQGMISILTILLVGVAFFFIRKITLKSMRLKMGSTIMSRDLQNAMEQIRLEVSRFPKVFKTKGTNKEKMAEINETKERIEEIIEKTTKYIGGDIQKVS